MVLLHHVLMLVTAVTPVPVKQLGCPPSDLAQGWMIEPVPAEHGARSHHAIHPIEFDGNRCTLTIEVPESPRLRLLPVGVDAVGWTIHAIEPGGTVHAGYGTRSRLLHGSLLPSIDEPSQRLDILDPSPGTWQVVIEGGDDRAPGQLWVSDDNPLHLRTWLHDASTLVGKPIHIGLGLSSLDDLHEHGDIASARSSVAGASMLDLSARLRFEDGQEETLEVVGNTIDFTPLRDGTAAVIVDAVASDGDGTLLHRTATLLLSIEAEAPILEGSALIELIDANRVACRLPLAMPGRRDRVLAGAEVWAPGPDGLNPRCWIGGMTAVKDGAIELVLDTRWLAEAGCDGHGVELRAVRLADVDSFVPLDRAHAIELPAFEVSTDRVDEADRRAMQQGAGDRFLEIPGIAAPARDAAVGSHALMLCHGYCSDGQSWPPSHFTGEVALYFNPEQNFTHDEFALDVWSYGNGFKSYSVVGHSQGGNAGLHLYSFYWSGMDWAQGARKVQVLGTPLQGTILAGDIAALGEIFGIQCGANYDMTYDGAAQWASWLPGWSRAETWAWSTTFTDVWWWYDYCHILSDLVLWDPEDGVVEAWAAHLDGTNDMGTKEGWCHIQDMVDPAQVYDTVRNDEIDSEAAR